MTTPDRHRAHTVPNVRIPQEFWDALQNVALKHEVSVNWIVNRAIRKGLPAVLHHLQELDPDS